MCKLLNLFCFLIFVYDVSARDSSDASNTGDFGTQISKEFQTDAHSLIKDFKEENFNSSAKENCNETQKCANGGSCLQHVCVCLPGTSGPFCKTIDDCVNGRLCGKEETYCTYSIEKQKAECACGVIEYRFDEVSRTCKNCICSSGWSSDFSVFSYCGYQKGNKMCVCREGYAYNPNYEYCESCTCGKHSKWCKFDLNGKKVCACEDGFSNTLYSGSCDTECNCGDHGKCQYRSTWSKTTYCDCDAGYDEFNKTCIECTCGKYGKCIFDNDGYQIGCKCTDGYEEKSGTCEMCYCGDNANCSFNGNIKKCDCAEGYHDVNGFCEDINECERFNPCDSSSICVNTPGSHKCLCAEGYQVKMKTLNDGTEVQSCEDIDECKNPNTCSMADSACVNTVGSFACVCNPGFFTRGGIGSDTFCEKTADSSIYTVVSVIVFTVLVILLGFYIFSKRSTPRSEVYNQELRHS